MNKVEFFQFLKNEKEFISKISLKLLGLNQEYSLEQVRSIVVTAIFESTNSNKRGIYLSALNRILEEKGYQYKKSGLHKPTVRAKGNNDVLIEIASFCHYNIKKQSEVSNKIERLLVDSGLTQEEVFVTALTYGLDSPKNLLGKYKKILDNIEDIYYHRVLKKGEIAKIVGISMKKVSDIRETALEKIKRRNEIG